MFSGYAEGLLSEPKRSAPSLAAEVDTQPVRYERGAFDPFIGRLGRRVNTFTVPMRPWQTLCWTNGLNATPSTRGNVPASGGFCGQGAGRVADDLRMRPAGRLSMT